MQIASKNKEIAELDVWLGKKKKVKAYIDADIYKTIPKARKKYLKVTIDYDGPIPAPIKKNDVIGIIKISYKGKILNELNLLAYEDVNRLNIFSRLAKSINYLIWGDV